MPGLGGRELSKQHILKSAEALNLIDPDFIRIRTLALPPNLEICSDYCSGISTRSNDSDTAEELILLLKNLKGIHSYVRNDHILNLLPGVEGRLPDDRAAMIEEAESFLNLDTEERIIYRLGRRLGRLSSPSDLGNRAAVDGIRTLIDANRIDSGNIDGICEQLMMRFI